MVLFRHGSYRTGFALLLVSALLTIAIVFVASNLFPNPRELEAGHGLETKGFSRSYWLYLVAGAFFAAGFADFSLIAYHFQRSGSVAEPVIPIYYAVAMALGGASALVFGKWFDKAGLSILIAVFFVSAFFGPLVFFGHSWIVLCGMILWGIGMGAQNSLLKSVIAPLVRRDVRATGFGLFDTGFGVAWFLGSWVMAFSMKNRFLSSLSSQLRFNCFRFWLSRLQNEQNSQCSQITPDMPYKRHSCERGAVRSLRCWVAHASRVSATVSHHRELSPRLRKLIKRVSVGRRKSELDWYRTRDACATQPDSPPREL